jgi:Leucine-rich repeat (LRR) protein
MFFRFRKCLLPHLVLFLRSLSYAMAQQIDCEGIQNRRIDDIGDELLKACRMDETTVIDSTNFTLSSEYDEEMTEMYGNLNKKIEHLPENIYENFPKLISLGFESCSLRTVTVKSLRRLTLMKKINFGYNRITTIAIDAFEDLKNLQYLYLNSNRIKTMNGDVLKPLVHMFFLDLSDNACIDGDFGFYVEDYLEHVAEIVSQNCLIYEEYCVCKENLIALEKNIKVCGCSQPASKENEIVVEPSVLDETNDNEVSSQQVQCEYFITRLKYYAKPYRICRMDGSTVIDAENFDLSSELDESVTTIFAESNINIQYLPNNIYKAFPKLKTLNFKDCSLKIVIRKNFRNLNSLKSLDISFNRIETIVIGTFNDLINLEKLDLTLNYIKVLNGDVFKPLLNLKEVFLSDNLCIDESFYVEYQNLEEIATNVTINCLIVENFQTCKNNLNASQNFLETCSCPEVVTISESENTNSEEVTETVDNVEKSENIDMREVTESNGLEAENVYTEEAV